MTGGAVDGVAGPPNTTPTFTTMGAETDVARPVFAKSLLQLPW